MSDERFNDPLSDPFGGSASVWADVETAATSNSLRGSRVDDVFDSQHELVEKHALTESFSSLVVAEAISSHAEPVVEQRLPIVAGSPVVQQKVESPALPLVSDPLLSPLAYQQEQQRSLNPTPEPLTTHLDQPAASPVPASDQHAFLLTKSPTDNASTKLLVSEPSDEASGQSHIMFDPLLSPAKHFYDHDDEQSSVGHDIQPHNASPALPVAAYAFQVLVLDPAKKVDALSAHILYKVHTKVTESVPVV